MTPRSDRPVPVVRVTLAILRRPESQPLGKPSFAEEVLPWMDAVHRFALRLTRNRAEAEDLVQEALRTLREPAGKLARTPAAVTRTDVDGVRTAGHTDDALLHAVPITACFAFVNRLADRARRGLERQLRKAARVHRSGTSYPLRRTATVRPQLPGRDVIT